VTSSPQLTELVEAFAKDLSRTLTGFLGRRVDCGWNVNRDTGRILVEPTVRAVVLESCQKVILALRMEFWCTWDSAGKFLAVDESFVKVFLGDSINKEPLFRYEYVAKQQGGVAICAPPHPCPPGTDGLRYGHGGRRRSCPPQA
jgi:hypothetical protein